MPKDPPNKGKPPPKGEPSETRDVTASQIVSTQDLAKPAAPAPPARSAPRRSTTHGVGWYAAEDGDDLAQPVQQRSRKTLLIAIVVTLTVILAGLAGAYLWLQTRTPVPVAAALAAPDAAPPARDAAPVKMVRLSLASTPTGADFLLDGKPVGKAPVEIEVPEKSTVVVEAKLAQHEPFREQVDVAGKGKKVMARLVAIPADAGPPADAAVAADAGSTEKTISKSSAKKKAAKKKPSRTKKKRTRK